MPLEDIELPILFNIDEFALRGTMTDHLSIDDIEGPVFSLKTKELFKTLAIAIHQSKLIIKTMNLRMFAQLCLVCSLTYLGDGGNSWAQESKVVLMNKKSESNVNTEVNRKQPFSWELTFDIELVFETNQGLDFKNVHTLQYFVHNKLVKTGDISSFYSGEQFPRIVPGLRTDLTTLKKELEAEKELNPNSHVKIYLTASGLIVTREIWGSMIIFYHINESYNRDGFLLQEKKWQTGEHAFGRESSTTNTYDRNNRVTQIQKMTKNGREEEAQYETVRISYLENQMDISSKHGQVKVIFVRSSN